MKKHNCRVYNFWGNTLKHAWEQPQVLWYPQFVEMRGFAHWLRQSWFSWQSKQAFLSSKNIKSSNVCQVSSPCTLSAAQAVSVVWLVNGAWTYSGINFSSHADAQDLLGFTEHHDTLSNWDESLGNWMNRGVGARRSKEEIHHSTITEKRIQNWYPKSISGRCLKWQNYMRSKESASWKWSGTSLGLPTTVFGVSGRKTWEILEAIELFGSWQWILTTPHVIRLHRIKYTQTQTRLSKTRRSFSF